MKQVVFPQVGAEPEGADPGLTRFAWLAVAAAVVTIALKSGAYLLTGSVGLLSDAAESVVNLVAAVVAVVAPRVAARPADPLPSLHAFAHGIERDQPAVATGLTLPWNSGRVEGHVNRIKMIKRQMFGRAGLPLLRKRVLLA